MNVKDGRGNGNMKSIGVEICYSKSGGSRYEKAEDNAVELTAYLLDLYKLPISAVKQHHYWSGKNCPHRIRANGTWNDFLKRVQFALDKLQKGSSTVSSTKASSAPKTLHRIKSGTYKLKSEAESAKAKVAKNSLANEKYITIHEANGGWYFQTGTYAGKALAENALQRMKDLKILNVGHVIKA